MCQIKVTEFDGVPVRLYYPAGRKSKSPALVWIHGGGFVYGSAGKLVYNVYQTLKFVYGVLTLSINEFCAHTHMYTFFITSFQGMLGWPVL